LFVEAIADRIFLHRKIAEQTEQDEMGYGVDLRLSDDSPAFTAVLLKKF
jgi:hypothetical protein